MAEYIGREMAINLFYTVDPENDGTDGSTEIRKTANYSSEEIESMLSNLPPADVVPTVDAVGVVRCRDCKWFDPIKQECCGNVATDNEGGADFTINFEENDFCSFGERRSDEKINI